MNRIHLLNGREKAVSRRHPWVFDGAIKEKNAPVNAGETVLLCDSKDDPLALGAWSPASQLRIRVWSFDPQEKIDREFFRRRIADAVAYRKMLGVLEDNGGCRLIYSEADRLPGLIVDLYGNYAAIQFLSAGAEFFRDTITELLLELPFIKGIFERSDASVRKKENLPPRSGQLAGEKVPDVININENGLKFEVKIHEGQKTGFYFDLRSARETIRKFAKGRKVLNMFSYTGGFAVAAFAGGAVSVLNADSSLPALKQAQRNLELNGFTENFQNICGDVFQLLRDLDAKGEKFDMVILDPPKLIPGKSAMVKGCRAYQDLARLGFKLLNRGGVMANFSCSGAMDMPLFQKITADAAIEADVDSRIIHRFEQSPDHPVLLSVPETFYLKGLLSTIGEK